MRLDRHDCGEDVCPGAVHLLMQHIDPPGHGLDIGVEHGEVGDAVLRCGCRGLVPQGVEGECQQGRLELGEDQFAVWSGLGGMMVDATQGAGLGPVVPGHAEETADGRGQEITPLMRACHIYFTSS